MYVPIIIHNNRSWHTHYFSNQVTGIRLGDTAQSIFEDSVQVHKTEFQAQSAD